MICCYWMQEATHKMRIRIRIRIRMKMKMRVMDEEGVEKWRGYSIKSYREWEDIRHLYWPHT